MGWGLHPCSNRKSPLCLPGDVSLECVREVQGKLYYVTSLNHKIGYVSFCRLFTQRRDGTDRKCELLLKLCVNVGKQTENIIANTNTLNIPIFTCLLPPILFLPPFFLLSSRFSQPPCYHSSSFLISRFFFVSFSFSILFFAFLFLLLLHPLVSLFLNHHHLLFLFHLIPVLLIILLLLLLFLCFHVLILSFHPFR